jgi:hypothetical protein
MGLVVIGQIDTIIPNTNSSTIKSLSFPKITKIMETNFLGISGNKLDSKTTLSAGVSRLLHIYVCTRETLSLDFNSVKHLAITTSFNTSLSGFNGHFNISEMDSRINLMSTYPSLEITALLEEM